MDFAAGYISGAASILIGNPLDVLKVRIQSSPSHSTTTTTTARSSTLLKGIAAPILTYGALNALLYATYNRCLPLLSPHTASTPASPRPTYPYSAHFLAGVLAGLATFVISTPTELIKCRAQLASTPSWSITRAIYTHRGLRGFYHGGATTALRDAIGYGFYFLVYEAATDAWPARAERWASPSVDEQLQILLCGGLAGVATWASIFPLDVLKSRVQTHPAFLPVAAAARAEAEPLLPRIERRARSDGGGAGCGGGGGGGARGGGGAAAGGSVPSTLTLARHAVQQEGWAVLFRGLGVCSARAFIVNAVQWSVYELVMRAGRAA